MDTISQRTYDANIQKYNSQYKKMTKSLIFCHLVDFTVIIFSLLPT